MSTLLTLDEGRARLDPLADLYLVEPCKKAVDEWNGFERTSPDLAAAFTPTTRANFVHDLTVRGVRRALADDPLAHVREVEHLKFFALGVGTDVLLRFKHVGHGAPRNYPTEQQQELSRHEFDEEFTEALSLAGIPGAPTLVTCGYSLGFDGTLGVVSIRCDHKGQLLWSHVIWGDEGRGFGSLEQLPLDPSMSPSGVIVRSTRRPDAQEVEALGVDTGDKR